MTRQYATFDCAMWDDPDGFPALTAGAQRTYFMLVTQRDIGACGVLPLTLRRWASTCVEKDVKAWLDELAEYRYVVIDEATEELFIRTFMKWDAGYKHAKRVQAVIASALAIRSESIRTAALRELATLGVSVPNRMPIESLRSVVNVVGYEPHSTLHTPEREPQPADASAGPPSMFCSKHPNGTEEPCGPCGTAKLAYAAHVKAVTDAQIAQRAAAQSRRTGAVLSDIAQAKANAVPRSKAAPS